MTSYNNCVENAEVKIGQDELIENTAWKVFGGTWNFHLLEIFKCFIEELDYLLGANWAQIERI